MPGTYAKRRTGLKPRSPRVAVPLPGVGGYDYPRGPFGATGFPGSTPASARTHRQDPGGRRDRQLDTTQIWARDTGPAALDPAPVRTFRPQPSYSRVRFTPGVTDPASRFIRGDGTPRQPRARQRRSTAVEKRMTPVLPGPGESRGVRNTIAQRYKARPELIRAYTPAPNPGKTGARLDAGAQYHPGVFVHGHPDGKPVPGMDSNPGIDSPVVTVPSRYVSPEGSQEGYAMDRPLLFARGGTPAPYPDSYSRSTGNHHMRGGRLTGQRYYGAIRDQQQIGLPTDAYGLSRARGPRHRPVGFTQPAPWTANYYDVPGGTSAPSDMIHNSPTRPRSTGRPKRG